MKQTYTLLFILFFVFSNSSWLSDIIEEKAKKLEKAVEGNAIGAKQSYSSAETREKLGSQWWETTIKHNSVSGSKIEVSKYIKHLPEDFHKPLQNGYGKLVNNVGVGPALAIIAGIAALATTLTLKAVIDLLEKAIEAPKKSLKNILRALRKKKV